MEVHINPLPAGNVINAFDSLCAGSAFYVKFDVSGNAPFSVTLDGDLVTEQSKTNISGPRDSIAFTPFSTQEFAMISIEDDSGCLADPATFVPLVAGIVFEIPVAKAGIDSAVCGDSYIFQAEKTNELYKGLWSGTGASFDDPTDEFSEVVIDAFSTKTFTWTETNWHCTDEDEVEIIFYEQPQQPDAGWDQELEFMYQAQLHAAAPSVGSGKWTISSGSGFFEKDTDPQSYVNELSDQATLKWTVTHGNCPAVTDSMSILVNPLIIPKGFTPDGSGENDYFRFGADHAESIKLKVYNSSGVLVYESDNYNDDEGNNWEGYNMNGVKLPEGTYYYIATIKVTGKQQEVQFRSFVEIMR